MWSLTIKNNILATSMYVDEWVDLGNPSIFIYDVPELVDPSVKTEKLWVKELKCPIEGFDISNMALNTTSLFAVTRNLERGLKMNVWDFWKYEN